METEELKASVISEIESYRNQLINLSFRIHSNPEPGFHEFQAAAWLTEFLEKNKFSIERNFCGLPTSFRASYGKGTPVIAILAEYDALPELGHACGHNLIATSAVGAGIGSRAAINRLGGTITVIGTPAEELYGGKVTMINNGGFKNIDIAAMVHPGVINCATIETLACIELKVEFFGKPAHAAARPEAGINALEAMLLSFNAINSLRQHIKRQARIHGIITHGGDAANVVPDHSSADFLVRADDNEYLDELKVKVHNCLLGAATATGARLEYKWGDISYAPMLNNMTLARLFANNMKSLGRKIKIKVNNASFGSTDIGNVSRLVPSIHPLIAIASPKVTTHTKEFANAAVSEEGNRGLLDAAKALGMTVVDLLANPKIINNIKEEFKRNK